MDTMPEWSAVSDAIRGARGFALSGNNGQAVATAAESWLAATAEWQRELMGFVSMRLEKDSDAVREIMACKNPADVTGVQVRWMEETLRDYNSRTTKLMAIYIKSVNCGGRIGR
jgi:hypothetical protein